MKFACCYIVLNEEEYIKYSLHSIYNFASQIIIVHGSTKHASLVNHEGLSVDCTKVEIEDFMDKHDYKNKIKYLEVPHVEGKEQLRNAYIDALNPNIDWVLVVDGDEVYSDSMLKKIIDTLTSNPNLVHCFYNMIWFWGDFKHICKYNEPFIKLSEKYKHHLQWDYTNDYRARQGEFHERLYRHGLGFRHIKSHSIVSDPLGRDVYFHGDFIKQRAIIEGGFHHYGYIKPLKKLFDKWMHYHKRDGAANPHENKPEYVRFLEGEDIDSEVKRIIEFKGTHPYVMVKHPYYRKNVKDL